jgi:mannan endo-1,4-beta-mannosidase
MVMLMALALAALSVILAAGEFNYTFKNTTPPAHASLPPLTAAYLGVFPSGTPSGYQPVAEFAQAAGKQPNLAGYFSGWAESFDTGYADTLRDHHVTLLVQINPTDASLAAIVAGTYDPYLRGYADAVKDFRSAVVIGFGPEMNASWTQWGYNHVSPSLWIAAWRHVVTLFRRQGAGNVTWLWTVQADQQGTGPIEDWWPGAKYVTWVGIDGFYYRPSDTFAKVFGGTIAQVRTFAGKTPVLLSETAVGPQAGQLAEILDLFRGMVTYKTLGLVWFNIDQDAGIYHQDWQIQGSVGAVEAFRLGAHEYLTKLQQA